MAHGKGHAKGCKCGFCSKSHLHTKHKRRRRRH
jgi:hypothetical protein